ncbi:MAG: TRAP transporter large permease subunit [Burkholderiales bacterium]|nr:TRAP transporter large permease subunit [Burkholderiales bacterium]
MDIQTTTLLIAAGMVLLLAAGLPLAFVTGVVAMVVALVQFGPASLTLIASRTYTLMSEFVLVAVPMFLLMASILERSGVARDLFRAMHIWAGEPARRARRADHGGRGADGGDDRHHRRRDRTARPDRAAADAAREVRPQPRHRHHLRRRILGTMIPPSIVLIVYGLTANVSIGDLFVATVVPGLLLAALYIAYIVGLCHLRPEAGPLAPAEDRAIPLREKIALLRNLVLPIAVAAWVLGSIYAGIASVSEAAGMGVVGALGTAAVRRELKWAMLAAALRQTMGTCGMLLWLTFGANALIGVYNLMGGTRFLQGMITGLPLSPLMIVVVMMLVLVVLGMFMDWIGITLLAMPIFVPAVVELGFDPIWFGILFCMNMQISYLTPPFGPAAFYLKGVAPTEITLNQIFAALWPFIALQVVGLALVLAFPALALWLPAKVFG